MPENIYIEIVTPEAPAQIELQPYLVIEEGEGGGAPAWGEITGTLASQTDLQAALNAKQNSLGYTAENAANKSTSVTTDQASNTKYPSVKAVFDWVVATFQAALGLTPENVANKDIDSTFAANSDTKYPSQKAVKTAMDGKVPTSRTVAGYALTGDITLTKNNVGLGSADNTSDADKPVSTAQATAIGLKIDIGAAAGGDLDGTYPNPAILNSAVLAKVLTGLNVTGSTILNTDSIIEAFGKVQNQLNGMLGGAIYQGVFNATTNSPAIIDGTGTKGHYYVVSVAGTQDLGSGNIDFQVGDWAIYNGTIWQKVDNTDAVSSVNGYIGAINLTSADITEVTNLYFTTARVIATALTGFTSGAGTVAASDTILQAIQKLDGNIAAKVAANSAITGATKTKVTYDAKGLVTAGADATTADIADSSNKRYVTDAQQTVIGNTSGTNTGDQNLSSYATKTGAETLTNKRWTRRVLALSANSATPAINTDNYDEVHITGQVAAITSFTTNLTGTPADGDSLIITVTATGTIAITHGTSFEASGGCPLTITTVGTAKISMGFKWNTETSKWRQVAQA